MLTRVSKNKLAAVGAAMVVLPAASYAADIRVMCYQDGNRMRRHGRHRQTFRGTKPRHQGNSGRGEAALAWDRSGHRFAGPAISYGAKIFDAKGDLVLDDDYKTSIRRHGRRCCVPRLWRVDADAPRAPFAWFADDARHVRGAGRAPAG